MANIYNMTPDHRLCWYGMVMLKAQFFAINKTGLEFLATTCMCMLSKSGKRRM